MHQSNDHQMQEIRMCVVTQIAKIIRANYQSLPKRVLFDDLCMESCPCVHRSVGIELENGTVVQLGEEDGMVIALLSRELQIPVPGHFKNYLDR